MLLMDLSSWLVAVHEEQIALGVCRLQRGILVRNTASSSQGTARSGAVHVNSYRRTAVMNVSMAL